MKAHQFTNVAGAMLIGVALMKVFTNLAGRGLVRPHEPVLGLSINTLFWILAAVELAVAWVCLFGQRPVIKLFLLLWLGINYLVCIGGLVWSNAYTGFGVYLVSVQETFRLPGSVAFFAFQALALYLVGGSIVSLLLLRAENRGFVKTACSHCGGHIEFPVTGLGRTISCPHCDGTVSLQQPSLKQA